MSHRAAFHESGHAIAALALGHSVRALVLSLRSGIVRFPEGAARTMSHADSRIITAAGPVAECRFRGVAYPVVLAGVPSWDSDARHLDASVAVHFDGADCHRAYRAAMQSAEIIVEDLWREISVVADAAARVMFLDEADIRSLVAVPAYDRRRLALDPHQQRAQDEEVLELRHRFQRMNPNSAHSSSRPVQVHPKDIERRAKVFEVFAA